MGMPLTVNCLLVLPAEFDTAQLRAGETYTIEKDGVRLFPIGVPLEVCTSRHQYLAKIKVTVLTLTPERTVISFIVLKLFSPEESRVYSDNFVRT